MRITSLALILTGLLLSTMACSKYEENPMLSLRTKKARLDGNWSLVLVKDKNVDVTHTYPDDYGYDFDKNGTFKKRNNETETMGEWEFSDDKTLLRLTETNSPTPDVFKLIKLTNRHLWWSVVGAKDELVMHFEVKK